MQGQGSCFLAGCQTGATWLLERLHFTPSAPHGAPPAKSPDPPLLSLPDSPCLNSHLPICWAEFCFLNISVIRLILLGWSVVISLSQCPNLNFSCKVPSVLSCHIHKFPGLRHTHLWGAIPPTFPQIERNSNSIFFLLLNGKKEGNISLLIFYYAFI